MFQQGKEVIFLRQIGVDKLPANVSFGFGDLNRRSLGRPRTSICQFSGRRLRCGISAPIILRNCSVRCVTSKLRDDQRSMFSSVGAGTRHSLLSGGRTLSDNWSRVSGRILFLLGNQFLHVEFQRLLQVFVEPSLCWKILEAALAHRKKPSQCLDTFSAGSAHVRTGYVSTLGERDFASDLAVVFYAENAVLCLRARDNLFQCGE
jgi:hypothetical protein